MKLTVEFEYCTESICTSLEDSPLEFDYAKELCKGTLKW